MKRTLPWLIGVGCVGVALAFVLRGPRQETSLAIAQTQSESAPAASPAPEKVIHTFEDDAKIQAFAQLWQQRQTTVVRMLVLQGYLKQEQDNLPQLNDKLSSDFKVDVAKNYTLDGERRVLIEQPAPAAQPASPGAAPADSSQAASAPAAAQPAEETIVYTFPDEEKIKEFAQLWQTRQASLLRMTVLQSYLNQEQGGLTQLNDRLSTEYQVDVTKNYTVDRDRRVLIELLPAASQQPAAPQTPS